MIEVCCLEVSFMYKNPRLFQTIHNTHLFARINHTTDLFVVVETFDFYQIIYGHPTICCLKPFVIIVYITNIVPEVYHPKWRGKPENSAKQGSEDFIHLSSEQDETYLNAVRLALDTYEELVLAGVAPEQARFVLPQGMFTEWFWTGSLSAYMRFYNQRSETHAQWEIRQYADAIMKVVKELFPWSVKYLTN